MVLGAVGVLLLVVGLVFGDALDGVLPESDWLSMTAVAAFLVALGFGGYLLETSTPAGAPLAAAGGFAAGIALGAVALRMSRSLAGMSTDGTPTVSDLVGVQGRVITAIPAGSTGEVMVRLGGQPMKLTAVLSEGSSKAVNGETIDRETEIVVVRAMSPTRVEVQTADEFWLSPEN